MQRHNIVLHYDEALICELLDVVRNHHDSMPGGPRDRPGMDRMRIRVPTGDVVVVDLWSGSGQDAAAAPPRVEVYDSGDLFRWRPAPEAGSTAATPASVSHGARPAARVLQLPVVSDERQGASASTGSPGSRAPALPAAPDVTSSPVPGGDPAERDRTRART